MEVDGDDTDRLSTQQEAGDVSHHLRRIAAAIYVSRRAAGASEEDSAATAAAAAATDPAGRSNTPAAAAAAASIHKHAVAEATALFGKARTQSRSLALSNRGDRLAVAEVRNRMDATHLAAQNMKYEINHLFREIEKCNDYE